MRHKRIGRKLGVKSKHRKAMFRNMATELLKHDRIKTSDVRAKEIRRVVEKLITLAKKGTLESRRKAEGYLRDRDVVKKLFTELADRFKNRPGGYTRIVKLGFRRGDNTPLSLIELIEEEYKPKKKKSSAKKAEPENAAKNEAKSSKKESAEDLGLVETSATAEAADADVQAEEPVTEKSPSDTVEAKKADDNESGNTESAEPETAKGQPVSKDNADENVETEESESMDAQTKAVSEEEKAESAAPEDNESEKEDTAKKE